MDPSMGPNLRFMPTFVQPTNSNILHTQHQQPPPQPQHTSSSNGTYLTRIVDPAQMRALSDAHHVGLNPTSYVYSCRHQQCVFKLVANARGDGSFDVYSLGSHQHSHHSSQMGNQSQQQHYSNSNFIIAVGLENCIGAQQQAAASHGQSHSGKIGGCEISE
jgi:hypothetical protein